MEILTRVFTPSKNRRLNELVGFLLVASAVLLFLALVSYSPLDNSWNTAATTPAASPARNWIGVVGAMTSDLLLQGAGVTIFLVPVMIGMLGSRWFKSRPVDSPIAKSIGVFALLLFVPALLALLPWHLRFRHAAAMEGLVGRVFGDILIHYFNLVGAYIVCTGVITAALYLSTAFSLGAARLWMETRFAFAFAARDRFVDWMNARKAARRRRAEEKARAKAAKPLLTTQLIQKKIVVAPLVPASPVKTGIDRMMEEAESPASTKSGGPEVGSRADIERKGKTIMPKVAGGYKLPSTALLHRPDAQHAVDEDELKELAQVLVSKCAEFDVHGQITQINPGPVVTTYEMKPEAGIKYSRITGLQEDLCLALRAESVLIERMAGKATVGIQVPNRDRETIWLREVIEA